MFQFGRYLLLSSSQMCIRDRYLNMEGVSRDRARLFWEAPEHGWNNKIGIAGTDFL